MSGATSPAALAPPAPPPARWLQRIAALNLVFGVVSLAVMFFYSLAFLIGLTDLTGVGRQINANLLTAPVEVYFTLLVIYFSVNSLLTMVSRRIEDVRRFNRVFVRL